MLVNQEDYQMRLIDSAFCGHAEVQSFSLPSSSMIPAPLYRHILQYASILFAAAPKDLTLLMPLP